jgi:hypothetical protein
MTCRTLFASIATVALALSAVACFPTAEYPMAAHAMKPAGN